MTPEKAVYALAAEY